MAKKIDWQAELINSINRNRVSISRIESDYARKMRPIYNRLLKNLEKEIDSLFVKVSDNGRWNYSDALKYSRVKTLTKRIKKIIGQADTETRAEVRKMIKQLSRTEFKEVADILNDFGISGNMARYRINFRKFEQSMLSQPIQGLGYLERIGRISSRQSQLIEEEIKTSMVLGEGVKKTISRVRRINDLGKAAAERLVRTSAITASNQAHFSAYEKSDVIKKWKWSSALDDRTCPICGNRDGQIYDLKERSIIPAHFNCRCTATPYIDPSTWSKLLPGDVSQYGTGKRIARDPETGKNYKVGASDNWRDWINSLPDNEAKSILGDGKFNLWKQNKITLNQLSRDGKIQSLNTLKKNINKK